MIDEDILCEDLFQWMENELKLLERAKKLKQLKQQKADIKTLVTVILCSADYYTESEIKSLIKMLDKIIGMPQIKRNCMKGNNYLKNGKYAEAVAEFERIIISTQAAEITPEEYGDIYHNLAIAKLHTTGLREASKLFEQAYLRNQREESLRQFLYTLKLYDNNGEFLQKIEEYQVDEETKNSILEYLNSKEQEANNSQAMKEVDYLYNKKAQGKMSEYYSKLDEMIDAWKLKIRQS